MDSQNETRWLGWHFLECPGRLRDGTPAASDGEVEAFEGPLRLSESGLRASPTALDALRYNPGGWTLRRVALDGPQGHGPGLSCAARRRVLWTLRAELVRPLVLDWACWCAEQALDRLRSNPGKDAELWKLACRASEDGIAIARRSIAGSSDDDAVRRAACVAIQSCGYSDATFATSGALRATLSDAMISHAAADAADAAVGNKVAANAELERRLFAIAPGGIEGGSDDR